MKKILLLIIFCVLTFSHAHSEFLKKPKTVTFTVNEVYYNLSYFSGDIQEIRKPVKHLKGTFEVEIHYQPSAEDPKTGTVDVKISSKDEVIESLSLTQCRLMENVSGYGYPSYGVIDYISNDQIIDVKITLDTMNKIITLGAEFLRVE